MFHVAPEIRIVSPTRKRKCPFLKPIDRASGCDDMPEAYHNILRFIYGGHNVKKFPTRGKTYFLLELLKRAQDKIQPSPQRIIWLYKRWQPLYDAIQKTVLPRVEFIKGIPLNLDSDDFLDTRIRNLLIMDDMMSTASKDPRVTDLFTEGSHHRNLSIIGINQSLFFNKSPTQRRNCHYLVLFKNPIDQLKVMTLARQMYPGQSKYFMDKFTDATSKPYGYLLLDLKPTTPEALRMRTDIFSINGVDKDEHAYLSENPGAVQTYNTAVNEDKLVPLDINQNSDYMDQDQKKQTMPSCDDCGVVLENSHDLQTHVKTWCARQMSLKREAPDDEDDIFTKRHRHTAHGEDMGSDREYDNINSGREEKVYEELAELSRARNEDAWSQKVDKYEKDGLSASEAKQKANKKLQDADMSQFVYIYGTLLGHMLNLRGGHLHTQVLDTIETYIACDVDVKKAIRLALRKYKHYFEDYIQRDAVEEDSDSNDGDETDSDV